MGQDVKNRSKVCPLPPGPLEDLNQQLKPRTIMAVSLAFMLTTAGLVYYWIPKSPPPPPPPPPPEIDPIIESGVITIDGDANFSDTALLEGWPGNGSSENPFIIDGLHIDLGGEFGHCIMISNTRVSFTISNCNLTGAGGSTFSSEDVGIYLENVTNSELVNNTCNNNGYGIWLYNSTYNAVANNTCGSNYQGITLTSSYSNTVTDNTCNNNGREEQPWKNGEGISIYHGSDFNTVTDNTCNGNDQGIVLFDADSNTLANNTCNYNKVGIDFEYESNHNTVANNTCNYNIVGITLTSSYSNTVTNNTCNSNDIGIFIQESSYNIAVTNTCKDNRIGIYLTYGCLASNIIADNTFSGNTEHDIFDEAQSSEEYVPGEFDPIIFLPIGLAGIIMLGAGWRMVKLSRVESKEE